MICLVLGYRLELRLLGGPDGCDLVVEEVIITSGLGEVFHDFAVGVCHNDIKCADCCYICP